MPPKKSNTLTEAELRLMKILWRRGESAVNDLVAAMPDGETLAYNSVLTTIRILEQKGYVDHRQEGRAFVYRPCVAEEEASRSEVRHLMSRFFGNSREQLLLSLLGDDEISPAELDRLKEAIRLAAPDENEMRRSRVAMQMAAFTPVLIASFPGQLSGVAGSLESALRAISPQAAGAALTALWQGALVVGSLALCLRLAPRTSAAHRFLCGRGVHHSGEFAGAGAGVELNVGCGLAVRQRRACRWIERVAAAG